MKQAIISFRQDEAGDWIADLACGHAQHIRHQPPWQLRPWATTTEGRESKLGTAIDCPLCNESPAT